MVPLYLPPESVSERFWYMYVPPPFKFVLSALMSATDRGGPGWKPCRAWAAL